MLNNNNESSYLERQKRIKQKKKQNEIQKNINNSKQPESARKPRMHETQSNKQIGTNKKIGTRRTASVSAPIIGENKKKKENLLLTLNSIVLGLGVHRDNAETNSQGVKGFINSNNNNNNNKREITPTRGNDFIDDKTLRNSKNSCKKTIHNKNEDKDKSFNTSKLIGKSNDINDVEKSFFIPPSGRKRSSSTNIKSSYRDIDLDPNLNNTKKASKKELEYKNYSKKTSFNLRNGSRDLDNGENINNKSFMRKQGGNSKSRKPSDDYETLKKDSSRNFNNGGFYKKTTFEESKRNESSISTSRNFGNKNEVVYSFNCKNPFSFYPLEKDSLRDRKNNSVIIVNNLNQRQRELLKELNLKNLFKVINYDIKKVKDINTIKSLQINQLNVKGLLSFCEEKFYENEQYRGKIEELQFLIGNLNKTKENTLEKVEEMANKINNIDNQKINFDGNPLKDESKQSLIEESMLKEEIAELEERKKKLKEQIQLIKDKYLEDIQQLTELSQQIQKEVSNSDERIKIKIEAANHNNNNNNKTKFNFTPLSTSNKNELNIHVITEAHYKGNYSKIGSKSIPKYSVKNLNPINTDNPNHSYSTKKVSFSKDGGSYSKKRKK